MKHEKMIRRIKDATLCLHAVCSCFSLFVFFCCECVRFYSLGLGAAEVAFGHPCKRVGHQNHDGPYRQDMARLPLFQSGYCSLHSESALGHIQTLGRTDERPHELNIKQFEHSP